MTIHWCLALALVVGITLATTQSDRSVGLYVAPAEPPAALRPQGLALVDQPWPEQHAILLATPWWVTPRGLDLKKAACPTNVMHSPRCMVLKNWFPSGIPPPGEKPTQPPLLLPSEFS